MYRKYPTISCRGLYLNYLKKISQITWWSSVGIVFYNKLSWFLSELPEKDISNVGFQPQRVYSDFKRVHN